MPRPCCGEKSKHVLVHLVLARYWISAWSRPRVTWLMMGDKWLENRCGNVAIIIKTTTVHILALWYESTQICISSLHVSLHHTSRLTRQPSAKEVKSGELSVMNCHQSYVKKYHQSSSSRFMLLPNLTVSNALSSFILALAPASSACSASTCCLSG